MLYPVIKNCDSCNCFFSNCILCMNYSSADSIYNMHNLQRCYGLFGLLLVAVSSADIHLECSRNEYDRCIRIADPLIREAHLVFPDNMDDIDLVCRTWNKFVDCIKKYTDKCFSDQQRRQFNKAVENPIESVHQMCMQPHYQTGNYN